MLSKTIAIVCAVMLFGVSGNEACTDRDRALEQYSYTESIAPVIRAEMSAPQRADATEIPHVQTGDSETSADGSVRISALPLPNSAGKNALFISFFRNGHWTQPENMGKRVDPLGDATHLSIAPNGKTLYFFTAATFCDPSLAGTKPTRRTWKLDLAPWLTGGCVGNVQSGCTPS